MEDISALRLKIRLLQSAMVRKQEERIAANRNREFFMNIIDSQNFQHFAKSECETYKQTYDILMEKMKKDEKMIVRQITFNQNQENRAAIINMNQMANLPALNLRLLDEQRNETERPPKRRRTNDL